MRDRLVEFQVDTGKRGILNCPNSARSWLTGDFRAQSDLRTGYILAHLPKKAFWAPSLFAHIVRRIRCYLGPNTSVGSLQGEEDRLSSAARTAGIYGSRDIRPISRIAPQIVCELRPEWRQHTVKAEYMARGEDCGQRGYGHGVMYRAPAEMLQSLRMF